MIKFNPELKEFKTLFGVWWGFTWRIWAFVALFYVFLGLLGLVAIGLNAL